MSDSSTPPSPDVVTESMIFPNELPIKTDKTASSTQRSVPSGRAATEHFESEYYDEYDFYNFTPENKLFKHASGKGRSKAEASKHSSRLPSHWGILAKFENESNNRKKQAKDSRTRSVSK